MPAKRPGERAIGWNLRNNEGGRQCVLGKEVQQRKKRAFNRKLSRLLILRRFRSAVLAIGSSMNENSSALEIEIAPPPELSACQHGRRGTRRPRTDAATQAGPSRTMRGSVVRWGRCIVSIFELHGRGRRRPTRDCRRAREAPRAWICRHQRTSLWPCPRRSPPSSKTTLWKSRSAGTFDSYERPSTAFSFGQMPARWWLPSALNLNMNSIPKNCGA